MELVEQVPTKSKTLQILNKNTKGTDEYLKEREAYGEKLRKQKIQRTNMYESDYIKIVNKIFKEQEETITSKIREQKGKSIKQPKLDMLSSSRWVV